MARSVLPMAAATAVFAFISGCGSGVVERPQRPAWRAQAENVCLSQKLVRVSAYVQPGSGINGPSICGVEHPFKVTALSEGAVKITGTQTFGCPMVAALDQWLEKVIQPIAQVRFGQNVVELTAVGSFSCRPANNVPGAKLSEHSFANATDIGGFKLADGHHIVIARDWPKGTEQEKAFLREAIAGACEIFTTVLGPGYNALHYNHFHLDLAQHGRTSTGPRRICKPMPGPQNAPAPQKRDTLPDAPDVEDDDDLEVAQIPASRTRELNRAFAQNRLDAGVPATPVPRAQPPVQARAYNPYGMTPSAPVSPASGAPATMREDGTFVPEGDPSEWDVTGSIRRALR